MLAGSLNGAARYGKERFAWVFISVLKNIMECVGFVVWIRKL